MRHIFYKNRVCSAAPHHRLIRLVIFLLIFLVYVGSVGAEVMVPLTVTKGTTLITLTRTFCTSEYHWKELAKINKLQPPYRIFPGNKIYVPIELLKVEKVVGRVAAVSGSVYLVNNMTKLKKVEKGDTVLPGQTMVTENDGFAHIVFPNNKYMRVASNSKFSLTYMVKLVDDSLKAEFYLEKGRILHAIREKLKPNDSYQIKTPVSVTGVRGTEFRVKMFGGTKNVVETLGGIVAVGGAGVSTVVPSGSGFIVEKGKPPGNPTKLPPVPSPVKIEKIFQSLPVIIPAPQNDSALQYRLRLASDENGTGTVFEQTVTSGGNFKIFTVTDGIYFGFLTALTKEGLESLPSNPFKFQIRTVPAPPILSTPYAGKSLFDKTVTVQWLMQENVQNYHLQLASTPDFSVLINDWFHNKPTITWEDLGPGEYYIRLQAVAEDGFYSLYSTVDSWTVAMKPSLADMKVSGENGISLEWAEIGEGVTYELQVSTEKVFKNIVTEAKELEIPKFKYNEKLEPGTYYLRIRGVLADGQVSPWSETNSIKIKSPPFSLLDGTVLTLFSVIILLI